MRAKTRTRLLSGSKKRERNSASARNISWDRQGWGEISRFSLPPILPSLPVPDQIQLAASWQRGLGNYTAQLLWEESKEKTKECIRKHISIGPAQYFTWMHQTTYALHLIHSLPHFAFFSFYALNTHSWQNLHILSLFFDLNYLFLFLSPT